MEKKGAKTIEENRQAARKGYDFAVSHCAACAYQTAPAGPPRMLIGGNAGVGVGAVLSGCTFYSAYPMTPSTGILLFMAGQIGGIRHRGRTGRG